jgi:hypothetical protein
LLPSVAEKPDHWRYRPLRRAASGHAAVAAGFAERS